MKQQLEVPMIDADEASSSDVLLLDIREQDEWMAGRAARATHLPMSQLMARVAELDRSAPLICVCRSGGRSLQVTAWLRRQGFDARNLRGGMNAWVSAGLPVVDHYGRPGVVI